MKKSNFEFLKGVNDFMFSIARAAERNYPDDPNTTLVKTRIFGEATAKHLAKLLDIEIPDNQHDLLRELGKIPFVDDSILSVFHKLRKIGNQAVHEYHDDLQDAEMCLRLVFRLAVWYYRLVTKNYDFVAPVFQLPSSENREQFEQELLSLKEALAEARQSETQTKAEVAAQNAKLTALNGYISVLESKQEETAEQTEDRIKALQAQLKEKDEEIAKKTEAERKAYKKQITDEAASRSLDLSESESRYLIDNQLRKAGWDADSKLLSFANGTRPQIGRNIAIAEWPTGKDETGKTGFADYVLFIGLKAIGVIEAKKNNQDVVAKLSEAYRYSKYFDNVLFEGGKGTEIRRDLMDKCNLHTILRLPTGIFYAAGVKTNVLFFQKGTPENPNQDKDCTKETWVFDLRTNMNTCGKRRPLTEKHFDVFVNAYGSNANGLSAREEGVCETLGNIFAEGEDSVEHTLENARFRKFSRDYIRDQKGDSLDISWLKDLEATSAENLPAPEVLAGEAMAELTEAMAEIY